MKFTTKRIADGISLSVMPSDKFKAGVIALSLTVPLTRKGSAYNHILSGLLRRGTRKYPDMSSLNRRLDELYGSYVEIKSNHVGNNLSLSFVCEILDNKYIPDGTDTLGGVIDIVADMLLHPLFSDESFDSAIFDQEIRVILDALNAEINNTRAYAIKRCAELMFESYEDYPTVAETKQIVADATLEDLRAHYRALISEAPLEVFYIGATDADTVSSALLESFGTAHFGKEQRICKASPISRESFAEACERMPVSQGKLAMCFSTHTALSTDNNDYYVALMLNEIFGGSASSKLFLNVREKMSLCYYCSSSFSTYSGIMTVSSGIEVKNFGVVRAAVIDQLEQIRAGNISESELYAAKRSIENAYRQLYDSPFDLQSFYSGRMLFGISETIEDCREKLMAVSREQIVALAKKVTLDALFFVEGTACGDEDGDEEGDDE